QPTPHAVVWPAHAVLQWMGLTCHLLQLAEKQAIRTSAQGRDTAIGILLGSGIAFAEIQKIERGLPEAHGRWWQRDAACHGNASSAPPTAGRNEQDARYLYRRHSRGETPCNGSARS